MFFFCVYIYIYIYGLILKRNVHHSPYLSQAEQKSVNWL